jgi:hypothetical protein
MPGPFPGMDPYLEHPARWPDLHQSLITYMREVLNERLPRRFRARTGERLYVIASSRSIYPDVAVLERRSTSRIGEPHAQGSTAVADPPIVLTLEPTEHREPFLEIVPVSDESRLVTVIEVLSPVNKAPGSEGRRLYQTKQQELLASSTSLIEIDLLRTGEHTIAPPRAELLHWGPWDYLASLHRGGAGPTYEFWPNRLRQPLPAVLVPLDGDHQDVVLPLQAIFHRCYETGRYQDQIDYQQDPPVPLAGEDMQWADALLRERGLRA